MPQGVGSTWLKPPRRWARGSRETRHDGRRLGSFLHSLPSIVASTSGERGSLASRRGRTVERSCSGGSNQSYAQQMRVRRKLPVGLEPTRWCPRTTRDVRGRDDIGEGSSSRRTCGQARGVRIQNAVRRCHTTNCSGVALDRPSGRQGQRMRRRRIDRSGRERIAAPTFDGSGRANGSGPSRAPTPDEGSRCKTRDERAPRSRWFQLSSVRLMRG